MHILHYLKEVRLETGGVVRAVLDFCTYQARAGAQVTLATCDPADIPERWRTPGPDVPNVVTLPPAPPLPILQRSFQTAVEPLVRAADVVHLHVIWDPSQLAVAAAARALGKPYVQSPHGMLADWSVLQKKLKKDVYWRFFGKRFIDQAAYIVLTAQGELDQSAKRHPRTPGVVIPLVFDIDPFREAPTPELARRTLALPDPDVPTVLYLSRLHYKKRPDLLLAAGRRMRDLGARFNLVFAGPCGETYLKQLRDYARDLKIDDITTFLGMVPESVKPSLYRACDLFVLPTSMENFGFVYFEALASGTPVLTTRGTDTWRELVESGGGHIVNMIKSDVQEGQVGGGDIEELAQTAARLLADRAALRASGDRGREWVLKRLAPETTVKAYLDLYQKAIGERP